MRKRIPLEDVTVVVDHVDFVFEQMVPTLVSEADFVQLLVQKLILHEINHFFGGLVG